MARGFAGVRAASAKRSRGGGDFVRVNYFALGDGETAIVRFLEQDDDVAWCWVHNVSVDGLPFGRDVPCLDQDDEDIPCPGCENDIAKKFKGFINLIWEDAPVWKTDEDGKMVKPKMKVGEKDQVAMWNSGPMLFEMLDEINEKYRGLRSRRFEVRRKGVKLNTKYSINPEDVDSGPQEFSPKEKKLDEGKYDLNPFITPPSYEDFEEIMHPGSKERNTKEVREEAKAKNPFAKKRPRSRD